MEMTFLLAKFCRVPVKKACGKKKPEIQYTWEIRRERIKFNNTNEPAYVNKQTTSLTINEGSDNTVHELNLVWAFIFSKHQGDIQIRVWVSKSA